jgi:hypothetical protein
MAGFFGHVYVLYFILKRFFYQSIKINLPVALVCIPLLFPQTGAGTSNPNEPTMERQKYGWQQTEGHNAPRLIEDQIKTGDIQYMMDQKGNSRPIRLFCLQGNSHFRSTNPAF